VRGIVEGTLANRPGQLARNGSDPLYDSSVRPTPLHITLASQRRHIILANGNRFRVFAHSWSPELEAGYRTALPLEAALFEDNRPYQARLWAGGAAGIFNGQSDWHQLSFAVSMSKAATLVLEYANRSGRFFERVVFARPDVLMVTDLSFEKLPPAADLAYVSGNKAPAYSARDLKRYPEASYRKPGHGRQYSGDLHYVFSTRAQVEMIARLPELLASSSEAHTHHS
jgi:hypothetical protein